MIRHTAGNGKRNIMQELLQDAVTNFAFYLLQRFYSISNHFFEINK